MWIERTHTNTILEAVRSRPVVLLTGVRQVGKSSLLMKLFPDAEYITLDKILSAAEAQERDIKGKWILTGSQQFSLMQQVSESLAGRVKILRLGSLSASELINSEVLCKPSDMLWRRGFPEIWAEDLNATEYFDDYVQTYLERDLRQILNVSSLRDFRRFFCCLPLG